MFPYDWIAPFYDPVLRPVYRPFRQHALDLLPCLTGATVLDLACGTGQNFAGLSTRLGGHGRIIGVDLSGPMLRRARRAVKTSRPPQLFLLRMDAAHLSPETIHDRAGVTRVDAVICTYGFTAMRNWQTAFQKAYTLLKPGGFFLVHDMYAANPTLHIRLIEKITRIDQTRKTWELLEKQCADFRLEYLAPSSWLFGGRPFVATGTKPSSA